MQAKDGLLALVVTKNCLANVEKTWLEDGSGTKYCQQAEASAAQHFVILLVTFFKQANAKLRVNVILTNPSAMLANNTVIKVNQNIEVFVLIFFPVETFQSPSNSTWTWT